MTATEWLEKEIYARGPIGEDTPIWLKELYEQAKEMEKQQIIDAYAQGRFDYEDFSKGIKQKVKQSKQYYNETYGSKGSDEVEKSEKPINLTSSQTEISDEEIEKEADKYFEEHTDDMGYDGFKEGAKWYREQLKKKQ